jgi:dephospho-CoA kinase
MALTDHAAIVLITGIPAAGKSTVADRLARRFERGVHVRGDVFRRMVVTGRHDMTSTPSEEAWRQLRLRYRLTAHAADTYGLPP